MNKIFFFIALIAMSSCTFVPNRMFKTPKDYVFAKDTVVKAEEPYIIRIDDKIDLHIFSNDGFRLVDVTTTNTTQVGNSENIEYVVEETGEVKLPVIGHFRIIGYSIKDAENLLQEKYSQYYKDPFVLIRVVSRKALVFHGDGGKGTVIPIQNDHTTLFEALALAGGLSEFSKAKKIRIIRGDYKNPQVYAADISSIEGLRESELKVYPNDIIYVDSGAGFTKRLTSEFLPYITTLASLLVLFTYIKQ